MGLGSRGIFLKCFREKTRREARRTGYIRRGAMGRPKKAAVVRRALLNKDTNLPAPTEVKPVENVDEEVSDFEEQLRIVNLVCNAVDQEGKLSLVFSLPPPPSSLIGVDIVSFSLCKDVEVCRIFAVWSCCSHFDSN